MLIFKLNNNYYNQQFLAIMISYKVCYSYFAFTYIKTGKKTIKFIHCISRLIRNEIDTLKFL